MDVNIYKAEKLCKRFWEKNRIFKFLDQSTRDFEEPLLALWYFSGRSKIFSGLGIFLVENH